MSRKASNCDSGRRWYHQYDFLARLSPFQGLERGPGRYERSPGVEAFMPRNQAPPNRVSSFSPVGSPFAECRPNACTPAERAAAERLSSLRGRRISPFERSIKRESPEPKFSETSGHTRNRGPDSSRSRSPRVPSIFPTPFSPRIVQSLDILPSRTTASPAPSHKRKKVSDKSLPHSYLQDYQERKEPDPVPVHTAYNTRAAVKDRSASPMVSIQAEDSGLKRGQSQIKAQDHVNPPHEQVSESESQQQPPVELHSEPDPESNPEPDPEPELELELEPEPEPETRLQQDVVVKAEPTVHTPGEANETEARETSGTTATEEAKESSFQQRFNCKLCAMEFSNGQALGGHMSRTHPGKSRDFNHKKDVRKRREFDRVKLLLAKKRYFNSLDYDYEDLMSTPQGKLRAKSLMNRSRIKRLKAKITDDEVNNYVESHALGTIAEA